MQRRIVALVVLGCLLAGCGSFMAEPDSPEYQAAAKPFQDLVQSTSGRLRSATIGNYPVPALHWREVEAVALVLAMKAEHYEAQPPPTPNQGSAQTLPAPTPGRPTEETAEQFLSRYPDLEPDQKHGLKRVRELLAEPGWFYEKHEPTVWQCQEQAGKQVCKDEQERWFSQNSLRTVMAKLQFDPDELQLVRELLWNGCDVQWTPRLGQSGWAWPLAFDSNYPAISSFPITSPFGSRPNPITNDPNSMEQHDGIDVPVPTCTPVYAAHAGKVDLVDRAGNTGCGVEVKIVMANPPDLPGLRSVGTRYCHLLEIQVEEGQEVAAGQPIALSGNSGTYTTGPHLHFEVHVNGVSLDPFHYFG